MTNLFIRGVPDNIDTLISANNPAAARGQSSLRASWMRAAICVSALGSLNPELAIAVFSLWQSALQIAKKRRAEDDLQSGETIRGKLAKQYGDFDHARTQFGEQSVQALSKLSNVLYYAALDYVQGGDLGNFQDGCEHACRLVHLPLELAFQIAAAKYRIRAVRKAKDQKLEYAAMRHVLEAAKIH